MRSAPSFKQTILPLFQYPLVFLGAQSVQGVLSLLESILEPRFNQNNPILLVAIFFPPYVITTTVSSALTFYLIKDIRLGRRPSLISAIEGVRSHLKSLVLCSFILGVIYILGFCAFVLPVIYFMAVYLFVPYLILTEDKQRMSVYLYRSTVAAKKNLSLSILTVLGIVGVGLLTFAVSRYLTDIINRTFISEGIQLFFSFAVDLVLTLITGVWIDSWVSHYFLNIKEAENV